jgi:Asp-tRNA(Asn)/Glu-tRNA(Gln) amidotransferase A subunit family amidase
MTASQLCSLSAVQLRDAYRSRTLSPREVLAAVLERIEQLNPQLTTFFTVTAELAEKQARRAEDAYVRRNDHAPLLGIPVSVKDLIPTAGVRTTYGSLMHEREVPTEDAPVIDRLYAAGALLLGKTATSEFGWKAPAASPLFGSSRNPWDIERTTGGSSGGSAAAVATGMGPLSIGTDGGGSIRIPASFCGVVGLKPSAGRVPNAPPGLAGDLDHVGPLARTVRDTALVLDAVAGDDVRDWYSLPRDQVSYLAATERGVAGLRFAWSSDLGYAPREAEVAEVAETAARRFEDIGCIVDDANPGWSDPVDTFQTLFYEVWGASMADALPEWEDKLDPGLVEVIRRAGSRKTADFVAAAQHRITMRQRATKFFERYDLLLTPTTSLRPFSLGIDVPSEVAGHPVRDMQWTSFTFPFNLTGLPAISVPAGWSADGVPIGLQIVGPWRDDARVLRAAAAYEQVAPWADRWPPVVGPSARTVG